MLLHKMMIYSRRSGLGVMILDFGYFQILFQNGIMMNEIT